MRRVRAVNETRDTVLASHAIVAEHWWQRARGMLGRPAPQPGAGMLLVPCRSIHMFGMRYALDVVFLDAAGRVVAVHAAVPPGAQAHARRPAHQALELPAGTIDATHTAVGDSIALLPAS